MPASSTDAVGRAPAASWAVLQRWDTTLPVWIAAALLLVFLMLFPLGSIFHASLWDETGFSLGRYLEVFTNAVFLKAIWNTVVISFWVGVISVVAARCSRW
jgi:ABC-type Fe3+ transport system permease subunit